MKIAVMALGSLGDVNPFLGIASELARRGHTVTFFTNPYFEDWVRAAKLPFQPLGTKEEFEGHFDDPDLWDPNRAMEMIFRIAAEWSLDSFNRLAALKKDGLDLIVAPFQCFGARLAEEALGVPLATLMPNPILVESVYDPVRYPVLQPLAKCGPTGARAMYAIVTWVFERTVRPRISRARAALGLPKLKVLGSWVWSPELIIGLWPSWLRPRQRDWFPQMKLTGFITYDGPEKAGDVRNDLARHEDCLARRPVVFTAGTAMTQGRAFFAIASEAARRLSLPALFVTRFAEQLPATLPEGTRHLSFAPFRDLLPRCSAIVHHGGIGTSARALQAGIPQLILPSAHDQFDNAHLLERAGVGLSLNVKSSGAALAARLGQLLDSPSIAERCRALAAELAPQQPLAETCELIEALGARR